MGGAAEERDARTSMLSVRLGQEEQEKVRAVAESRGETVSQFIREAVMDRCDPRESAPIDAYQSTSTVVTSGFSLEVQDGQIVPKTGGSAYVATTY